MANRIPKKAHAIDAMIAYAIENHDNPLWGKKLERATRSLSATEKLDIESRIWDLVSNNLRREDYDTERRARVLAYRFYQGKTLCEIAELEGIIPERVRQVVADIGRYIWVALTE